MAANRTENAPTVDVELAEPRVKGTRRYCFDCDFFMPYCKEAGALQESDWKTGCEDGECRYGPPYLGPMIKTKDDEERFFGEWPKVMFCDWCGKFVPRKKRADKYASLTVPEGFDVKKTEDGHTRTFKRS